MGAKGKVQKFGNWSEDQLITLIAAYQTEKMLYDDSHPKYFNQNERIKAYYRIRDIMLSRFNESYTLGQIKKKVCYLRSSFISETRKRDSLIAAGQCTKESYTPTWWCYGIVNFLDDFINLSSIKKTWNKNCKKSSIQSKSNEQHKSASEDSVIEIQSEKKKTFMKRKAVDEPKSSDDSMSETEVPNKKRRVHIKSKTDDQHKSSDDSLFDTEVPNENDDFVAEETESGNNFPKMISILRNGASKLDEVSMHSENSDDFESSSLEVQCLRLQEIQDELERRAVPGSTSQHTRIEIDDESSSAIDSLKSTTEVEAKQKSSNNLQTTLENFCPGDIFKASTPKRLKLSNAKDSNLLPEQASDTQRNYDRENIFGQYVATELKTIRDNPLLYLKTKQAILEIMTRASFDLISSE